MSEASLADRTIEHVRTWIDPSRAPQSRPDQERPKTASPKTTSTDEPVALAHLANDPAAVDFVVQFIDLVIRPEDPATAARHLKRLTRDLPAFLSPGERRKLRAGGRFARMSPEFVQNRARKTLREMLGRLVLDARPDQLSKAIADLTRSGDRLNVSLLGEAVLGEEQAVRHRDNVIALVGRQDVDYVSVKVSSIASQLSLWSFDATVDRVVERLAPVLAEAAAKDTFVNLDMEAYRDVDLTVAVFMRALDRYPDLAAGIALQAYLPDSLAHLQEIQEWAAARVAGGGAPVKVRIVKGANLSLEQVDSSLHGWPAPTWPTKRETDTHFKRMLHWALEPERVANVRVGVATHNLFDVAYAWHLAGDHDVRDLVEFEVLHGFDEGPMGAVRQDVGPLRLYTPVVHEEEFDAAIAYLV
ncbi:MAG TPA: proline dehydrogenase family protein, partial [Aeromicrobium sp.]|nr:proline dehydrogenase family protein [Aeromicrobium sp.]